MSDRAQITRPTGPAAEQVDGLRSVIKADQLKTKIDLFSAQRIDIEGAEANQATVVSAATIENVARQFAALHTPARYPWAKRFGLPEHASLAQETSLYGSGGFGRIVFPGVSASRTSRLQARPYCESCGDTVSDAVIEYCRQYAALFEGSVLCVPCQDEFYPDRY